MQQSKEGAIQAELERILDAPEFKNSSVLQRFLTFIVTETIAGRESALKSVVVAQAVFARGPDDDRADSVVRTTAVRLRSALNSANARAYEGRKVIIRLPKGRYVPTFEFIGDIIVPIPRHKSFNVRSSFKRIGALVAAGLLAIVLIAPLVWGRAAPQPNEPIITVQPTQAINQQTSELASEIDRRLAPHMASIGLGRIVDATQRPISATESGWSLNLRIRANAPHNEIGWDLIDSDGEILWTAREHIEADRSDGVRRAVSRIAFKILGENGAIPLLAERRSGDNRIGATCTTRAQLLLRVETHFDEIRSCLTEHVMANPNDPTAWATLSAALAIRSRYQSAREQPGFNDLNSDADEAADMAFRLAPNAYLTRVAQMQVALSRGDIEAFLTLQRRLRNDFPGDLYLHLRIASRLARLGHGDDALEIYREADRNGINLSNFGAELALAHLVEGDTEAAFERIVRAQSNQQYVLVLKAAILGLVERREEARLAVDQLLQTNPHIREEFYPWFSRLLWNRELLETVDRGLALAGLDVVSSAESGRLPY